MPGFKEYFHFDEDGYEYKISRPYYPTSTLRNNIYQKRRMIVAAGTAICGGVLLSVITSGASLLALPLPARKLDVEKQKLRLLEAEWIRCGHNKLPSRTVEDKIIPCLVTGAASAVCCGIDIGIAHAGAHTVNEAAAVGSVQLAGDVATNTIPPGTGHLLAQGIENGIKQTAGLVGHSSHFMAAAPCGSPAFAVGQAVGVKIAQDSAEFAVKQTGGALMKR